MPTSPNMSLTIPVPTVTPGAQYAFDEVSCFNQIDQHNHTSGLGVQIPTAGLNINANLPLNNYGLLNTQLVNLQPQASISTNGSVYRVSDDLYYRDGAGNNVRITQAGSIAVSGAIGFTGLPSGTASASYNSPSQTFIFQSATNTPANIDGASIVVRPLSASAQGITISAPSPLASSYSLELPAALPAVNSVIKASSAGALSFPPFSDVQNPVGSMIMFGGSSAPVGWLICDGSIVSQSTYSALYSVIGASFNTGGEGAGNFRLPDFRRRVGVGAGGTGSATLGNAVGNSGGAETVTLTISEMPSHSHNLTGSSLLLWDIFPSGSFAITTGGGPFNTAAPVPNTGGGQPHNNLQPSLVVNYIIKT